jgi:hypothetical protein
MLPDLRVIPRIGLQSAIASILLKGLRQETDGPSNVKASASKARYTSRCCGACLRS